ncbi:hypothetical protein JZ751_011160 [Albula glossodonta]|uniref:Uncharacterized protein n=1 Tax=Albula glossodonta TaxID=121402 RepID=A0A8T2NYK9_9TELE|nr:hypothetical protein JZ751_011160 [Albula glossodonta]
MFSKPVLRSADPQEKQNGTFVENGANQHFTHRSPAELCRDCRVCSTMSFHWSSEISWAQAGIPRVGRFTAAMVLFTSSTCSGWLVIVTTTSTILVFPHSSLVFLGILAAPLPADFGSSSIRQPLLAQLFLGVR